jgi:hypothetical protein
MSEHANFLHEDAPPGENSERALRAARAASREGQHDVAIAMAHAAGVFAVAAAIVNVADAIDALTAAVEKVSEAP